MAFIRGTNGNDTGVFALIGTENPDSVNAFAGDDELFGNGGGDALFGDAGNDELFGGEGNDSLDGGLDGTPTDDDFVEDSDTLDGGNGLDTASYAQVQHGMFVNLFQGLAFGQGNVDTLVSIENITGTNFVDSIIGDNNANLVQGAGGNDRLDTEGGNDFLSGSGGDDTLIGGAGKDNMFGGSGADKFVFELASESAKGLGNRDVINGFERGVDRFDLGQIDAAAGPAGNQAFTFIGNSAFSAEGQVRFFFEGDHTVVALNTTGTSGAESQIQLTGLVDLAAADFVL